MSETLLHEVARAIEDAWDAAGEDDGDPAADALVAAHAALAVIRERIEALRYESRYMIGGDAELGESSDWIWRNAVLALFEEDA